MISPPSTVYVISWLLESRKCAYGQSWFRGRFAAQDNAFSEHFHVIKRCLSNEINVNVDLGPTRGYCNRAMTVVWLLLTGCGDGRRVMKRAPKRTVRVLNS